MSDAEIRARVAVRGTGFRRLRRLTSVTAAVTVALAGAFTAMAARSFPGHKHARTVVPPTVRRSAAKPVAAVKVAPPPALPADSSSSQSVTPLAPSSTPAPAPVQQQPVVVSGGS
jgi:hypothetical protein